MIFQNRIHTINMYNGGYIISCFTPIPSVATNLKNIFPVWPLWGEFTSEYYNDNNQAFGLLFQYYIAGFVEKNYHTSILNECKDNMDKSSHKDKYNLSAYLPSEKSEFTQILNVDHWPILILN